MDAQTQIVRSIRGIQRLDEMAVLDELAQAELALAEATKDIPEFVDLGALGYYTRESVLCGTHKISPEISALVDLVHELRGLRNGLTLAGLGR